MKKPPKVVVPVRIGVSGKALIQAIAEDQGESYTVWIRDAAEARARTHLAGLSPAKRAAIMAAAKKHTDTKD